MSAADATLIQQFLDHYNAGELDRADPLMDPQYVHHRNAHALTFAQFKRGAAWGRAGMPDFHLEVVDQLTDGDKVVLRMIGRGTHLGSLYGETPTSRQVALHVILIVRIADGRIAEDWEALDEADLMRQVGALPSDA